MKRMTRKSMAKFQEERWERKRELEAKSNEAKEWLDDAISLAQRKGLRIRSVKKYRKERIVHFASLDDPTEDSSVVLWYKMVGLAFPVVRSMICTFRSKFRKRELLFFEICRIRKSISKLPPEYGMPILDLNCPAFLKRVDTPRAAIKEIMTVIRNANAIEKQVKNILNRKLSSVDDRK